MRFLRYASVEHTWTGGDLCGRGSGRGGPPARDPQSPSCSAKEGAATEVRRGAKLSFHPLLLFRRVRRVCLVRLAVPAAGEPTSVAALRDLVDSHLELLRYG